MTVERTAWNDSEKAIRFAIGCSTPLPTRCPLCRKYNRGIGLDYCLFSHWKSNLIQDAVKLNSEQAERGKTE